jgi:hypothetical protein
MIFPRKNSKVYVDFFGFHGCGKTTVLKELSKILNKNRRSFFVGSSISEIEKVNMVNLFIFMLLYPFRSLRLFFNYWKYNKKRGRIYFGKKRVLISCFLFHNKNCEYFFDENFLHKEIFRNFFDKKDFPLFLNLYPKDNLFFVFIDVVPEVAYKRAKQRGDKKAKLKDYVRAHKSYLDLYNYLKKDAKFKVIKIDGLNSFNNNANCIFNFLLDNQ